MIIPNFLLPNHMQCLVLLVDDFLRNFHTQTHRIADQGDDEDSESDEDLEAADYVDDESDDSRNGEDNAMEGDADPLIR